MRRDICSQLADQAWPSAIPASAILILDSDLPPGPPRVRRIFRDSPSGIGTRKAQGLLRVQDRLDLLPWHVVARASGRVAAHISRMCPECHG